MGNNFVAVDLHVHTPASKPCYKKSFENDKDEYLQILKDYIQKDVKAIAITDHNTIKGYSELMSIKDELDNALKIFESYNVNDSKEILKIKKDRELFDKILILPGIEYETRDNIHYLLIFNNIEDIIRINGFLISNGYPISKQGKDENDIACDALSSEDLLNDIADKDIICIAAHADSAKGIYNYTNKGGHRKRIFCSSTLKGICYNNKITCEKIKSLIKEYKRPHPIAYLTFSDYHGENPASKITYFKIKDKINYLEIKKAFDLPEELISLTKNPKIENIIKKIAKNLNTICLSKNEFINNKDFEKAICAILNNGNGYILIGVQDKPIIASIGIDEISEEFLKSKFNNVKPSNNKCEISFSIKYESYGNGKFIYIIRISNDSDSIFYFEEDCYIYNNKTFKKAHFKEMEEIINKIYKKKFERFFNKYISKLDNHISYMNSIRNAVENFNIIDKINNYSIQLSKIVEIETVISNTIFTDIDNWGLGVADENVCFIYNIDGPRLKDSSLRSKIVYTSDNEYTLKNTQFSNKVILIHKGAVYYVDKDKWKLASEDKCSLLALSQYNENIDLLYVCAWLKSSINLFYIYIQNNTFDISSHDYFNNIVCPIYKNRDKIIINIMQEILNKENEFLNNIENNFNDIDDDMKDFIQNHNKEIDALWIQIDEEFYKLLEISTSERSLIESLLREKQIFVYENLNNPN